ncbi:PREDICTED: cytochrome P450 CYP749A22-like [Nicotiana attenuata]|uniref:Cytochrome p450 cyp749a22 n=1 Tax=Nicotiana attenuata TaxID=49451 RepID=A0A1J6I6D0_NICAT|nr:PREDICTED: cytochrome P450 CYP749A22-like [Nicotiana attenuata]OIT00020.1 cytochrome p450 cyp749a22 [Nicotiana attenuata]
MIIILASFLFIFLLILLVWIFKKLWWSPIRVQFLMRSQGIQGPSYKLLHGNTKEIVQMRKDSITKSMDHLSHDIFPRILPHVFSWKNLYGANFLYWYGLQPELVVTEPQLLKEILSNRNNNFPKIDLEGFSKKLLGDGVSSSKGEKWTKMRKLANHVFHGESLKSMVPMMIMSCETMLEKWKMYEEKEIEVFEEFRILTSEIISRTAFGSSYLEGKNIFQMLMKLALLVSRNAHKIRFPGISQIWKSRDEIESEKLEQGIRDSITRIIKKREEEIIGEEHNFGSDFLGKLLEANQEDYRISVEDIVDECKTFYFAGHETTTSLLGWTILLLATNKNWQEKARKEVLELFGKNVPTADGLSRLKIMNMIIEESLRLYPPVPFIKRKVNKKVQLGKLTLPPQMQLYISPLAVQRDPKIWGEDVHIFKPERFAEGVVKATNNNPVAFLPFGYGPRTCLGLNFAMIEAKVTFAMILQRYMFSVSPNYVHSPVQLFMLRPQHGVKVTLHKI